MHELIDNPIQDSVEACPPQETNLEGKRIILILILTKDIFFVASNISYTVSLAPLETSSSSE